MYTLRRLHAEVTTFAHCCTELKVPLQAEEDARLKAEEEARLAKIAARKAKIAAAKAAKNR